MSSTRHPSDPDCVADLGAQYVTATKEYREQHGTYYDELLSSGVLKPLSAASLDGARHKADDISYVAPAGMSSIAKHFMKDSRSDVKFGQKLTNLTMDGETWSATTESGESVSFDAVVLTQPAPQILELPGAVAEILASQSDVRAELEKVEYSSRFAIAVYYDGKQGYDGMLGGGGQVRARYTKDDPAIRYLALGNLKTDGATEENPSTLVVVVHTSVPFGNEHLERDKEEIGKIVEVCMSRSIDYNVK
jgi:renalase